MNYIFLDVWEKTQSVKIFFIFMYLGYIMKLSFARQISWPFFPKKYCLHHYDIKHNKKLICGRNETRIFITFRKKRKKMMIYKNVQTFGVSNIFNNLTLLFSNDALNCIKNIYICKKNSNKSVI